MNKKIMVNLVLTMMLVLNIVFSPQTMYAVSQVFDTDTTTMVKNEKIVDGQVLETRTKNKAGEQKDVDNNILKDETLLEEIGDDNLNEETQVDNSNNSEDDAEHLPQKKTEVPVDKAPEGINNIDPPIDETAVENEMVPENATFSVLQGNWVKNVVMTVTTTDNNTFILPDGESITFTPSELNALILDYTLVSPPNTVINAGDTYTIVLPEIFEGSSAAVSLLVEGTEVGTYTVTNGEVAILFNDKAKEFDDLNINIKISGQFDTTQLIEEEVIEVVIPYGEGGFFTTTIIAEEIPYDGEDKKIAGQPYIIDENGEKVYKDVTGQPVTNPTHIDWTVRLNDSMATVSEATYTDYFGDDLELLPESILVEKLIRNYENQVIGQEEVVVAPLISDSRFEIDLGSIEDAYDISYTTLINRPNGGGAKTISNTGLIFLDGSETPVSDSFEGTWYEDLPTITKQGSISEQDPSIIDWEVTYNYGQEDLGTVILEDLISGVDSQTKNITEKIKLLKDTIKVRKVVPDSNGNVLNPEDFTPVSGSFPLELNAQGQAYYITFSTEVELGVQGTVTNIISDNLDPQNSATDSVVINTIPTFGKAGEQLVDDEGKPYIEWKITLNSQRINMGSMTIRDVFDQSLLDFNVADLSSYELYQDEITTEKLIGNSNYYIRNYTHSDNREGFALTVQNAGPHKYIFVYRTYYTTAGLQEPNIANNAELVYLFGEESGPGISFDVNLAGPKAGIKKVGSYVTSEDKTEQFIEWKITFNESNINLTKPIIEDSFSSGNYKYVNDSFELTSTNEGALAFDPTALIMNPSQGFTYQFGTDTNATYTIKYLTTVDDANNLDQINKVTLDWQGGKEEATANVYKRQAGINKKANIVIDAEGNKHINWIINFNTKKAVLANVVITDQYSPSTADMSNILLYRDGEEVDPSQYQVIEESQGSFELILGDIDAVPYTLTYTTSLSSGEEVNLIQNKALLTYTNGSELAFIKVPSPALSVNKEAVSLDKTPDNPVISWEITANANTSNLINLVDPVLTDTIPGDQALIQDSIKVYDQSGTLITDNLNVTINTDSNSFVIQLPNGSYQYKVQYDTEILQFPSFHESVLDRYTNSTTLSMIYEKEDVVASVSDTAYLDYFANNNSGLVAKTGTQNQLTENIDWTVTVNEEGLTIKNPIIEDQLSDKHSYLTDSFKVRDSANNLLNINEDYSITFAEDDRSFKLTLNDTITQAITISYSTRLNDNLIGTYQVTNTITLKGGEERKIIKETVTETTAQQYQFGGGGTGRKLDFKILKKAKSGKAIRDVGFKIENIDIHGNVDTVVSEVFTSEEGIYISDKLRAGKYILTETSTPEGFKTLASSIYFTINYSVDNPQSYELQLLNSNGEVAEIPNVSTNGNVITIINEPKEVKTPLKAKKILRGLNLADGQFHFELLNEDGEIISRAKNDVNGNIVFEALTFDTVGDYQYMIREKIDQQAGVTYDTNQYNVLISVTYDEQGHLATNIQYEEDDLPTFKNSYTPKVGKLSLLAEKKIEGLSLEKDQFNFQVFNENEEVVATGTNDSNGKVVFSELTFDKIGVYRYKIGEKKDNQLGIAYDQTTYDVIVKVTDDEKGQLQLVVEYPNNKVPVFTNVYTTQPGKASLIAKKELTGLDLIAGQFNFEVLNSDGEIISTASNDIDGKVAFTDISYENVGEYNYTIRETQDDQAGITYDDSTYDVTIIVTDNGAGQLVHEVVYPDQAIPVFKNSYTAAKGVLSLVAEKKLEGLDLVAGQFNFEVVDTNNAVVATGTNDSNGKVVFSELSFDTVGEYAYTLREVSDNQAGITYDDSVHEVVVTVTDDGTGLLRLSVTYQNDAIAVFKNIYTEISENPKDPEKPQEPENPKDPEKPQEPENPKDPEKPQESENPKDPEKPEKPEKPKNPDNPKNQENTKDTLPITGEETTYSLLALTVLIIGLMIYLLGKKGLSKKF
ncbi:Spy0128 family protein [Facklamia sp. P12950]|uniref:Spy0128 family protein n=1 Tax=Facklamia sp. P12950 TaxID=3421951 RepID=UPI003D17F8DC